MRNFSQLLTIRIITLLPDATRAVSAYSAGMQARMISSFVGLAFMSASMTRVGRNIGRGDLDRAEQSGWISSGMAMGLMSVVAVLFFVFPETIMAFFTSGVIVMMIETQSAIKTLHAIASRAAGYSREHFREREAELDVLDNEVLEAIEAQMLRDGPTPQLTALHREAEQIKIFLEERQAEFTRHLWSELQHAPEPAQAFQTQLRRYTDWPNPQTERRQEQLDTFLMRYLLPWPIPDSTLVRERDMVGYQPTPIRTLLDVCRQADFQRDDLFYDIGAGLGHVALLVHLLTGIRTRGVEIEPAYYRYACRLVDELRLSGVEFRNTDARHADYADGSVFFLYTPFKDALLHEVLNRIRRAADNRAIRIYTLGPATLQVAQQIWLQRRDQHDDRGYNAAVFQNVYR